jgi:hypothetical protein
MANFGPFMLPPDLQILLEYSHQDGEELDWSAAVLQAAGAASGSCATGILFLSSSCPTHLPHQLSPKLVRLS